MTFLYILIVLLLCNAANMGGEENDEQSYSHASFRKCSFLLLHTAFLGKILFEEMYLLQKKNTSSKQSH